MSPRTRRMILSLLLGFALLLAACETEPTATPIPPEDLMATIVAATLDARATQIASTPPITNTSPPPATATSTPTSTATAVPTETATATASPTPLPNNISGKVCYPGGDIPEMTVYFEETDTETLIELPVAAFQTEYEANLAPGTYIAYAWLTDFSRGGLYSKAVPCGLGSTCDDHTLLPFTVSADVSLEGINLCDWYIGPFAVPYPPGKEQSELVGKISGSIAYPGGNPPAVRVVFFNLATGNWVWVATLPGSSSYASIELAPGVYHVVAYTEEGQAGGHADASHSLIAVTVKAGEIAGGANLNDWDAPPGSFPADPSR